jgi:thiosulfate/3-mercaptopyruvate sulfurtransferase
MKHLLILIISSIYLLASNAFITPEELKSNMLNDNLVILDTTDIENFNNGHIPNAIQADASDFRHQEGPFQLINSSQKVQEKARALGINQNSQVVLYDHGNNKEILKASYIALSLIVNGFENVSILDGGYTGWVDEYKELISTKTITPKVGNFTAKYNPNIVIDLKYVKNHIGKTPMIEARPIRYFKAEAQSVGVRRLGHISKARSSFWGDKFNADGTIKSDEELKEIYLTHDKLNPKQEVITYCTGGLEASMNWYILYKHLHFKDVKIYDASMREWGNLDDTPMER